ncbi:MAG: hypothetical protein KDA65_07245 [Planctomycetaceae bacterium]|nr:hypothetical protein [Planctomycetaceae bacterium]
MSTTTSSDKYPPLSNRRSFVVTLLLGGMALLSLPKRILQAGPRGRGGNNGRGNRGGGGGQGGWGGQGQNDPNFKADQELFRTLLSNRQLIRREVKLLPNGVETLTQTDHPELRSVLVQHVQSMKKRVEESRPIHLRDPLFAALFRNAKKVSAMTVTPTEKGVRVVETSDDPFTVKLIQAHAQVVSLFIKNGHPEVQKNHALPQ